MIRGRRFRELFREHLGWDAADDSPLSLSFDWAGEKREFTVAYAAQKRGFVVCAAQSETMPSKAVRQRLQRHMSKLHHEHLLILSGKDGGQKWMVARKGTDKATRPWEVGFYANQKPELLLQKAEGMLFSMKEEGGLTLVDVIGRVEEVFAANAETVTQTFYKKFKEQLDKFQDFIKGLQEQVDSKQYASLMLNRLMFIYFIQKKKFLDGDQHYLRNRLKQTQKEYGKDKFFRNFYRHFLLELFHRGLGAREESRSEETKKLIGKVPYLNGGLFDQHALEREHGEDIQIPDKAFKSLFEFFDDWNWHLDDRPIASGRDINPDVIGYIFEQYINDRAAKGVYYTREDITGYIARNTILPHLLRRAKDGCKEAFDSEKGTIWKLLRENPEHYIYPAMRKGAALPDSDLPEHIRAGLDSQIPDLLKRREKWNTAAAEKWALPSETWREALERRRRCNALIADIKAKGVCDIADLTARNLNIEKLTLDALEQHEGSDFISAFYAAVAGRVERENSPAKERRGIAVLDPACGSGAFLFAALKVLESLYKMCVERMREFVAEADQLGKPKKHEHFRAVLADIKSHTNEEYWIYRSIILGNLFGADIMPEAAEVAKLRLFLKLAAAAEKDDKKPNMGLEPLPDIDFNIRSGNALVGFASIGEFEEHAGKNLDLSGGVIDDIKARALAVDLEYKLFVKKQDGGVISDIGSDSFHQSKKVLAGDLAELNSRLNAYLSQSYLSAGATPAEVAAWEKSHQPFHWASEFYGIVESGGFDVVIGNPPYVRYNAELRKQYTVQNYRTESCGDLYAFFVERVKRLAAKSSPFGMIIPMSSFATDNMTPLVNELMGMRLHISSYDMRPSKLFAGANLRLSIFLSLPYGQGINTTNYLRWYTIFRECLLDTLWYAPCEPAGKFNPVPKIGRSVDSSIMEKIQLSKPLSGFLSPRENKHCVYFHDAPFYWTRATNFIPYFWNEKNGEGRSSHVKKICASDGCAMSLCALINSSLFYWWYVAMSDCRDLNMREINNFPIHLENFHNAHGKVIAPLVEKLMANYRQHAIRKTIIKDSGKVVFDEFRQHHAKPLMDEIDKILAKHYGFSAEELDYIINYDYKYRMGRR